MFPALVGAVFQVPSARLSTQYLCTVYLDWILALCCLGNLWLPTVSFLPSILNLSSQRLSISDFSTNLLSKT